MTDPPVVSCPTTMVTSSLNAQQQLLINCGLQTKTTGKGPSGTWPPSGTSSAASFMSRQRGATPYKEMLR